MICRRSRRVAASFAIAASATTFCCGSSLAQNAPPPPSVTVQPVVSRQVTEAGTFIGRIVAIDKVDVVARVAGFIEQRNFTEGQQVKTGDLLFRIEQDTYKAAVDQQTASLAKSQATEVNTNLQLQRGQELIKNQNIPQSTVDQRAADEKSAAADVLQAQALLEQAKINLAYTEIRSPINGRIGLANFTVGNLVSPSSGTLATIVSQDPIYVTFPVSEADIIVYKQKVAEVGNPRVTLHIKLPDGTIYQHQGVTNFLDVKVDPNTDTVLVRAQLPNPDGILVPGGIVGVVTDRATPQPSLMVPQAAVLLDQAGSYVMVVSNAKTVEQRRITTGVEQGRDVVVKDGLKEGEQIIVEGIQKVHAGQTVTATQAPAK
jgi:membrane fusion protein (multidrug efflux system)